MAQVRLTSLEAFQDINVTPVLGQMQSLVYNTLNNFGDLTNKEIASICKLPINCVTPRTGELVKASLVECKGKKVQSNGRRAMVWGVK